MTDDVLVVHGGTPLQGQIRVRGAKNLVSKAVHGWVDNTKDMHRTRFLSVQR